MTEVVSLKKFRLISEEATSGTPFISEEATSGTPFIRNKKGL
ncbi:hypothetical protein ACM6QX_07195 [Enterococcus faecium]|nr:hypothetical protein [Enterococcus faecium]